MKNKWLIDVPVALIFFSRPEQFKCVFNEIAKIKPSKIFLIQDGPRDNYCDDLIKINECRIIAEKIDWECEVYKNYSEINLGCGQRIATGLSWAFEYVDRLVILEDDTVPNASFFSFCEEILNKYNNDHRIGMITGVNHVSTYKPNEFSYFFATCGSIAGWATWKRVWDNYDYNLSFVENNYYLDVLSKIYYPRWQSKEIIKRAKNLHNMVNKNVKLSSWSSQFGFSMWLNSQLVVVPTKNLITNIGLVKGASNGGTSKAIIPKKLQTIFYAKRFDITEPIIHPPYVIEDRNYNIEYQKVMYGGTLLVSRLIRTIESITRIIIVKYLKIKK